MTLRNKVVTDLHLHSPYARAVSPQMTIPTMSYQAARRGITLLATGDWTHPQWMKELEAELEVWSPGIYRSRREPDGAKFVLSTEISCIFSQGGKVRRVHLLVLIPDFVTAHQVIAALEKRGVNLRADGRPIMGLSCQAVTKLILDLNPLAMVIPAHAWTPWFGVLGSRGGFDSLAEAFGDCADQIFAIETGLSSDPLMNWRIPELDNRAIVSFSDAHSPPKMGREVTVFGLDDDQDTYAYIDLYQALSERKTGQNPGHLHLESTIEFYPEEGKYHWDGHRAHDFVQNPAATKKLGTTCPVCGKPLTVGVEYRVELLAAEDRPGSLLDSSSDEKEIIIKRNQADPTRAPFVSLVPLQEIIAETMGKGVGSKGVVTTYNQLLDELGSEFSILLDCSESELLAVAGERLTKAIMHVRRGELKIEPGYDGEYGRVTITKDEPAIQTALF